MERPPTALRPHAPARILVVEDDAPVARQVELLLELDGHTVQLAPTLARARRVLAGTPPDLVLLDLGLPDGDGLDLVAAIETAGPAGPAVLVVSGRAESLAQALELGARDFLSKPFQPHELRARVRAALRDRRNVARLDRTRRRARQIADRARRLQRLTAAVSQASDAAAVADALLREGMAALDASVGVLSLLSEDETRLSIIASVGLPRRVREDFSRFSIDADLPIAEVTRTGRPIFVGDGIRAVQRYPIIAPYHASASPFALAVAPLVARGRTVGAVSFRFTSGSIARSTRHFVVSLAEVGALAIERARLYEHARFQAHLLDAIDQPAIATAVDGTVTYWNRAAERLFGWTAEEALGRPVLDLTIAPAGRAGAAQLLARLALGEGINRELLGGRRDGTTFPLMATVSPVRGTDGNVIALIGLSVDLSEQRRAEMDRSRLARALALIEERDRIAMDLHDGAIQALYGTGLQLGALARTLPEESPARTGLSAAIGQLNGVIDDVRAYVHALGSTAPGAEGLRAGLEALIALYRSDRPRVELRMVAAREEAVEAALGTERVAQTLQIAREAVVNAVRHAGAAVVSVRIRWSRRRFVLEVRDDGAGLPGELPHSPTGHGLRNMAARADAAGGRLEFVSAPGEGTTVRLEIPLIRP